MRFRSSCAALAPLLLASSVAFAEPLAPIHAYHDAPPARLAAVGGGILPSARVGGRDRHGVPVFVWGAGTGSGAASVAGATLLDAALGHARDNAALWGLSRADVDRAEVARIHDTGRGGVIVVLRQAPGGVPLFHVELKVLVRRDGALVALSGSLRPDAVPAGPGAFGAGEAEAVRGALLDLHGASVGGLAEVALPARGLGWRSYELAAAPGGATSGVRFSVPARARRVLFPMPDRLVPAHHVEVFVATRPGGPIQAVGYVVAARTGEILYRRDLTASEAYDYRVWADLGDGRPLDGPTADFTPHPTGVPDGSGPAFVAPPLVKMDGFNQFADPWLPPGATESRGNNVDAYTDKEDGNAVGPADLRATVTSPLAFDHVYDLAADPLASVEQSAAAVTELFYVTNWQHDWWYDSGFDEAAGNAQEDNYGRGGAAGDRLQAQAQDGALVGNSNNANMSTPEDGVSPRMQVFVWDGLNIQSVASSSSASPLPAGAAQFGPTTFSLTAELSATDDGAAPLTDACTAPVNAVAGKIVLVDRGACSFEQKALNAQAAGAVGLVVANNQPGPPPNMPAAGLGGVTLPLLSVTQADGAGLAAALQGGVVTVTLTLATGGPRRDAALDSLIVSHEWGHYLHQRLVKCGIPQCGAQSEGWGDFVALMTALRPGDDLGGVYPAAGYSVLGKVDAYFGTRRMPYSTNPAVNPLTFQHIQSSAPLPGGVPQQAAGSVDNAEVHNAGEVFASMLFEAYVRLLEQSALPNPLYTFDEARRRMGDYVVAGMIMAPDEPSFTEQRDGLLAAAVASDPSDALLLAQGFAVRGAGSCAASPPKDALDNAGVVESFEVAPSLGITSVTLDDSLASCDSDGIIDDGEEGLLHVGLFNGSPLAALDTTLTVTAGDAAVTFPDGAVVSLPSLGPFEQQVVSLRVAFTGSVVGLVAFTVTAANAAACEPEVVREVRVLADRDDKPASSAVDSVESALSLWTPMGDLPDAVWAREQEPDGNHVWHGRALGQPSDTSLRSPVVTASVDQPLVLSFRHRFAFEADPSTFWDGGVVEIREQGGTWEDVSSFADLGYGGAVSDLAGNVLANQEAFVGQNPSWPAMDTVSAQLGAAFAGKDVEVRFRIGTDMAVGATGWELDDLGFSGLVGTPFSSLVPDACGEVPPVADAGADQTVTSGDAVTLDASGSVDPDGDPLAYAWLQVGPADVSLAPVAGEPAKSTFVAPAVTVERVLTFELTVLAGGAQATDTVTVRVLPPAVVAVEPGGGGCGCRAATGARSGWGLGALGLALAGWRRARRGRPDPSPQKAVLLTK